MTPTIRKRLSRQLSAALDTHEFAEQLAIAIDDGLGELAMAAIAAMPAGPARELEAATWARRAMKSNSDHVITLIKPGMSADEIEAHAAFMVALHQAARAE